ncbi:MAG: ABC transporter permease [Alphaproteobacteria bacterium]|nr:ABC transporter permease [Alphaproteobacteria bacterium]
MPGGRPGRPARARLRRLIGYWPALAVGAGALLFWELFGAVTGMPRYILPPMHEVVVAAVVDAKSHYIPAGLVTLQEIVLGFFLGTAAGVGAAAVLTASARLEAAVMPLMAGLRAVPVLVVAPLFVIWFGFGLEPKVLVAGFVCFFPVLVSTVVGLKSAPENELALFRSLMASPGQVYLKLKIPYAMPHIFVGVKSAAVLSVIGAIVGEWVGGGNGIGVILIRATIANATTSLLAGVIYIASAAVVLFLTIEGLERVLLRWYYESRATRGDAS